MVSNWIFNDLDKSVAQEFRDFLPNRIFDIHAHLYQVANVLPSPFLNEGPREVTIAVWRKHLQKQLGKSNLEGGLFFPYPAIKTKDIHKENTFLINQLKMKSESKGLVLISPKNSKDDIEEYLQNPQIAGFKPYYLFSDEKPAFQASISSY